jgi:hypothetical protein
MKYYKTDIVSKNKKIKKNRTSSKIRKHKPYRKYSSMACVKGQQQNDPFQNFKTTETE